MLYYLPETLTIGNCDIYATARDANNDIWYYYKYHDRYYYSKYLAPVVRNYDGGLATTCVTPLLTLNQKPVYLINGYYLWYCLELEKWVITLCCGLNPPSNQFTSLYGVLVENPYWIWSKSLEDMINDNEYEVDDIDTAELDIPLGKYSYHDPAMSTEEAEVNDIVLVGITDSTSDVFTSDQSYGLFIDGNNNKQRVGWLKFNLDGASDNVIETASVYNDENIFTIPALNDGTAPARILFKNGNYYIIANSLSNTEAKGFWRKEDTSTHVGTYDRVFTGTGDPPLPETYTITDIDGDSRYDNMPSSADTLTGQVALWRNNTDA